MIPDLKPAATDGRFGLLGKCFLASHMWQTEKKAG